mmetsp:Transcript_28462/g.87092  ORF Transcript_28462/g.87092 Transcript_28462/m.87092 type:complete len:100 (-) Transcript_28462:614-913(-)
MYDLPHFYAALEGIRSRPFFYTDHVPLSRGGRGAMRLPPSSLVRLHSRRPAPCGIPRPVWANLDVAFADDVTLSDHAPERRRDDVVDRRHPGALHSFHD